MEESVRIFVLFRKRQFEFYSAQIPFLPGLRASQYNFKAENQGWLKAGRRQAGMFRREVGTLCLKHMLSLIALRYGASQLDL